MANKKISDLTLQAAIVNADEMEVQVDGEAVTKRATVEVITKVERDARIAQDDVIEAGAGLDTDGTYDTPSGTNYIDGSTSIQNAVEMLDAAIGSSTLVTETVVVLAADLLACGGTPYELIAAQGADTVIEVISVAIRNKFNATRVECASQDLIVQYDTGASHFIEWSNTFIESAATIINKGTWTSNVTMIENKKIEMTTSAGVNPTAGDSSLKVFLTYKVWDWSAV